jgi:hypothetical protein
MFFKKKEKTEKKQEADLFDFKYDPRRVLYANDFEVEFDEWVTRKPNANHEDYGKHVVTAELTKDECRVGASSLHISGRLRGWNGMFIDVTKYIKDSVLDYECRVWAKMKPDAAPCSLHLSMETRKNIGGVLIPEFSYLDDYAAEDGIFSRCHDMPLVDTKDDGWVLLRGKFNLRKSNFHSVLIYIETTDEGGGNDIYLDDFVLLSGIRNSPD